MEKRKSSEEPRPVRTSLVTISGWSENHGSTIKRLPKGKPPMVKADSFPVRRSEESRKPGLTRSEKFRGERPKSLSAKNRSSWRPSVRDLPDEPKNRESTENVSERSYDKPFRTPSSSKIPKVVTPMPAQYMSKLPVQDMVRDITGHMETLPVPEEFQGISAVCCRQERDKKSQ